MTSLPVYDRSMSEENVAILYKSFSNNLLLGQWELARSCVSQLAKEGSVIGVDIHSVLRKTAEYPFTSSLGSSVLSCPHKLSWLCLLECKGLETDDDEEQEVSLQQLTTDVEFRLLLAETCQNVDSSVVKDLYLWFKHIHSSKPTSSRSTFISKATLSHVQHVLLSNPSQGYMLISYLSNHNRKKQQQQQQSPESRTCESLQALFITCINILLDELTKYATKEQPKCDEISEKVYTLLSFYDPVPYWNYSQLQQLFTRLLQLPDCGIRKDQVLSVLIGRESPYLVEIFCKLDHELSLAPRLKYGCHDSLSDDERDIIQLFSGNDMENCWRNIFQLSTQKQKHFLQLILETALSLVRSEDFTRLGELLQSAELLPLKPIVLLLGWSLCKTSTVARNLLDVLWDEKVPCRHPALSAGCRKLAYQIDLIQWCLDRTKPLLESSGIGLTNQERANHLLQGLEAHSVLYVLHQSTTLAALDQKEVLQLLRNTAKRQDNDSENKKKVVRFRFSGEDQNDKDGMDDCDNSDDISVDQQRDIAIYRSFCIIRNVMDAVAFCSCHADLELMNPICVKNAPQPLSLSRSFSGDVGLSSEGEDSGSQCGYQAGTSRDGQALGCGGESFSDLYERNVTEKLKDVQNHLKKLHPLTYRVEVLEDVFALLFATHRDVQECSSAADFDSDEGGEEGSKRNSQESVNTSMISDEGETSPLIYKTEFTFDRLPPESSQSVPVIGLGYDEPFQDQPVPKIGQSLIQNITVPQNQLAEEARKSAAAILRAEQKRTRSVSSGNWEKTSGHGSDKSAVFKLGFLANEYLVRDLLATLKDCLQDLGVVKLKLTGQYGKTTEEKIDNDPFPITRSLEELLVQCVKSSVTQDTLQRRLTRLTQYIHEAQWRFQLVSHDQLPKQPGQLLKNLVFVQADNNFDVCRSNNWKRHRTTSQTKARRPGSPGVEEEMQDVEIRRRSSRSGLRRSIPVDLEVIPLMLSTPDTLLTMSMSKGNFAQAAQVIKLFKLEKTEAATEMFFSEAYTKSASKIVKLETSTRERTGAPTHPGGLSMKALANVAAVGVASASLSNITQELLSLQTIAKLPKPKFTSNMPDYILRLFSEVDVDTAILLDLLCTSCKTWELCNKMLDIIKTKVVLEADSCDSVKWMDSSVPGKKSKSDVRIKGTLMFLREMEKLILKFSDVEDLLKTSVDEKMQRKNSSLNQQLRTATCPLVAGKVEAYISVVDKVRSWVDQINQAFENCSDLNRIDSLKLPEDGLLVSPQSSPKDSSPKDSSSKDSSPKDSSPQTKDLTKPSSIHSAYKQFAAALEHCVPKGGLVNLLKRQGVEVFQNKNYLLSLYDHVRELATLVAECEGRTTDRVVIPQNYFQTLQEGPIPILGRLMFAKRMIPSRLETVAENLSLNLTHIIVHSCCPRIPSKHLPQLHLNQDYEKYGPKIVYNSGQPIKGSLPSHPEELVRHILDQITTVMKDTASKFNAKGIFDASCAKLAMKSEEYREILQSTNQLQDVDLDLLQTRERALCFFANLRNLMTIHMYLHHIWQRALGQSNVDTSDDTPSASDKFCLVSTIDIVVHLEQFSYRVGQLGVISLFELKHIICRIGFPAPTNWKGLIPLRSLDASDYWMKYAPPLEARLLYVISEGCLSSPPIQVLVPGTVDTQLETAMQEYLTHTVDVDLQAKKVTVPSLLFWHREDFSESLGPAEDDRMIGLLNVIVTRISGTKGDNLQQLLDTECDADGPFQVAVGDHVSDFAFIFEMSSVLKNTTQSLLRGSLSPPRGLDTSFDSYLECSNPSFMVETPLYNLTPVTLDYVKMDSVLVATMVSLVCADELDDIERLTQEDYFESSSIKSRSTSMSDMSLVDIRSYRYQRLVDDYPILQRHLLNYIIPLAGADNPEILFSSDQVLKFVTNNIDDSVKTCMFSLHDSIQVQKVLLDLLDRLLRDRKWAAILLILKSIPETIMTENRHWQILHDFVLGCWAEEESETSPNGSEISNRLRRFFSQDAQARTVLSICRRLPVDCGIDLVECCLVETGGARGGGGGGGGGGGRTGLRTLLEKKLQELKVYSKITDRVKNLQFKLSKRTSEFVRADDMKYHSILVEFSDWRKVVSCSVTSPQDVLAILLRAGDFDIIRAWSKLHPISNKLKLEIEECHLVSLLSSDKPNTSKAFQILEDLRKEDSSVCLSICDGLLQKLSSHRDIQFLSSYMLNQLQEQLTDEQTQDLRLRLMGAKALLCLPKSLRGNYSHLICTPRLIIEQLLMNMKSDLAGQVFLKIKNDYLQIKTTYLRLNVDMFNQLLETYAAKAVEVTVLQNFESDKERSHSNCSGNSGRDDADMTLALGQRYLGESMRVRRRGMEGTVSPKPRGPSPIATSPRKQSFMSSSRMTSAHSPATTATFVMPIQPPPKDKWVPDSAVSTCMVCKLERFSMFNRRHHCRRCGRVVCGTCSTKRTSIDGESTRTCDDCYKHRFGSSDTKSQAGQQFYSEQTKESLSGSVYESTTTTVTSPEGSGTMPDQMLSDDWVMRDDARYDQDLRDEFYYEQAPSVSLCISILDHHSNRKECGQQMLNMCDYLSEFLQPIAPGVPNPEVDYGLIISMMRQLLFQAKLQFLKAGENQDLGRCDMYQTRVDLLKVLVTANYKDLPSIQELTKVDTVRRLRDKLIEDERLPLAMEVSTKCGLETNGVWAAWGKARLYTGNYMAAREKFSHCLKSPSDKNLTSSSSRLLQDIVDYLECMPITGTTESHSEEGSLETVQFQECIFYLRMYGSYVEHLAFLRRNGYWMKGAQFVINHRCSSEVFVDGLLSPALTSGDLGRLLDQMLMLDSTLDKWSVYLKAACRHCLKLKLYNALYQVQVFMKDFIRAAMTCITHFYQRRAQSYLDLAAHLHFLFTAQQHMQAFLDPGKWGSVRHPASSPTIKKAPDWTSHNTESAVRLVLTPDEVATHIRTIALQIEVTKFLEHCLTNQEGDSTALAVNYVAGAQTSNLPTLFGGSKVRVDLVSMILLSGNDITVSFNIALRIIKECRLPPSNIFTHTAREMAKCQRYAMIRQLLTCVEDGHVGDGDMLDEIIRAALLVLADKETQGKEVDNLIKLLRKDSNKINAYILCGKLRSAYLLAVKGERVEDVQRIAGAAQRMNQAAVRNICNKWLQQRK